MIADHDEWRFVRFGLLVTGKGEADFLPDLFRSLMAESHGRCTFEHIARVPQLTPRTSPKKELRLPGKGGKLPSKDEDIGIQTRRFLQRHDDHAFVLLIDDLEHDRADQHGQVFKHA